MANKRSDHNQDSEAQLPEGRSAQVPPRLPLPLPVTLEPSAVPVTDDVVLWARIRDVSERLSFQKYEAFIQGVCRIEGDSKDAALRKIGEGFALPFFRVDAYRLLKVVTELFLRSSACVGTPSDAEWAHLAQLATLQLGREISQGQIEHLWNTYTSGKDYLPYFELLRAKFSDSQVERSDSCRLLSIILEERLKQPCFVELIWSYWNEEAMLVQVLNAISLRFQNRRGPGNRPIFPQLEIDPLRPLNNLLWGYIQDEQHRLTIQRRAYEYDHHYGLRLRGHAVGPLEPADTRSNFVPAFHDLLHSTACFYKQDDDTTVRADGFPVLNALKEVNLCLGESGSNQIGDLPSTARGEMLVQQYILARPEMREFFAARPSTIYPEGWMERLESAKALLGISGPNVLHMYNLATLGERLLLSIRYGVWTAVNDAARAANWARAHRSEVQGYIHAYRAVADHDLSAHAAIDRMGSCPPEAMKHPRERARLFR
jgi:hypothetical protein